jgi:hypothetical protein
MCGAVRRLAVLPRRTPFPAAESLVAPVSPSPTKDAFLIGDSNRNTNEGYDGGTFRGTRARGPGTRAESKQNGSIRRECLDFPDSQPTKGMGRDFLGAVGIA